MNTETKKLHTIIAACEEIAQYLQSAWTQPCLPHYASQCDSRLGDGDSGDIIVSFSFWLTAEEYQEAA